MSRFTTVAEIAGMQLIGREVWAQPLIGHAVRGVLLEVRGDSEVIVLRRADGQEVVLPVGEGKGADGIEYLTWQVPMSQVTPGMRYRSFGPGFMARTVGAVETKCNCEASARGCDGAGEPLHEATVVVTSACSRYPERTHGAPEHLMWITTPEAA